MSKTSGETFGTGILCVFEDEAIDFTRESADKEHRPRAKKPGRRNSPPKRNSRKRRKQ